MEPQYNGWLVSKNLFKRSLAVFGHNLLGQLLIGIPVFLLCVLIAFGSGVWGSLRRDITQIQSRTADKLYVDQGYALTLGKQHVGSTTTTIAHVRLAQPGYVEVITLETFETRYVLGRSELLSAGEHYNVVINHRDPEMGTYRLGQEVQGRLYVDVGVNPGKYDIDDEVIVNRDGTPFEDELSID